MVNTGHDMFCPGVSMLHDGRVIVSGGESVAHVSIYDAATATWSSQQPLGIPRAYEVRSACMLFFVAWAPMTSIPLQEAGRCARLKDPANLCLRSQRLPDGVIWDR